MTSEVDLFDPFSESMRLDPYPVYRRYLDAGAVHPGKSAMPEYPEGWYVFGFEEAKEVLRSTAFIHQRNKALMEPGSILDLSGRHKLWEFLGNWFLLRDPPEHTMLRGLVAGPFRQDMVRLFELHVEKLANRLVKQALGEGGLDLMWDYAYPLSLGVIAHVLGIAMPELSGFKKNTRAIANALSIRNTSAAYDEAIIALSGLEDFLKSSIAEQKSGKGNQGLLAYLLYPPPGTEAVPDESIVYLMSFLLFAGQETVSDAIGNGVYLFSSRPEALEWVMSDIGRMPNAVEEILRFEPPVQYAVTRTAAMDVVIGEKRISKGAPVTVVIGAASRDGRKFEEPDRFDVSRLTSGDTLVFGKGIHVCLGIHLARLTLRIAFNQLFRHLPRNWRLAAPPVWREGLSLRGPASLPITW
jgi:cytochrome P450